MTPTLETPESNGESFVGKIAGFAKEVVSSLRKDADGKMKQRKDNLDEVVSSLDEIERLFSGETDHVEEGEELELGGEKARAFVNLVRSILDIPPLEEDDLDPDLSQDLVEDPVQGTRLRTGNKEVKYADLNFMKFKDVGDRLIKAGETAIGFKERLGAKSCWDWIKGVYDKAGVKMGKVVYQNTMNGKPTQGRFDVSYLVPGAWLYYYNGNSSKGDAPGQHSAILEEYNASTGMATVLSYTGGTQGTPRRHTVKLNPPDGELMGRITHIRLPGEIEDKPALS